MLINLNSKDTFFLQKKRQFGTVANTGSLKNNRFQQ